MQAPSAGTYDRQKLQRCRALYKALAALCFFIRRDAASNAQVFLFYAGCDILS